MSVESEVQACAWCGIKEAEVRFEREVVCGECHHQYSVEMRPKYTIFKPPTPLEFEVQLREMCVA
jgi:hypothetical protein